MKSNALLMALLSAYSSLADAAARTVRPPPEHLARPPSRRAPSGMPPPSTRGQCVLYQGVTYKAKWWTQAMFPSATDLGPWP